MRPLLIVFFLSFLSLKAFTQKQAFGRNDLNYYQREILSADTNIEKYLKYFIDTTKVTFEINTGNKLFSVDRDSGFPYLKQAILNTRFKRNDKLKLENISIKKNLKIYHRLLIAQKHWVDYQFLDSVIKKLFAFPPSFEKVELLMYCFDQRYEKGNTLKISLPFKLAATIDSITDVFERAQALFFIGKEQHFAKQYANAISYYYYALEDITNSKLGNNEKENWQASIYTNLGSIFLNYRSKAATNKAIYYFGQAIDLYSKTKNNQGILDALGTAISSANIVNSAYFSNDSEIRFRSRKIISSTLVMLKPIIEKYNKKEIKNELYFYNFFTLLGNLFRLENNIDLSTSYYLKAITSVQLGGDWSTLLSALENISFSYARQKNYSLAKQYIKLAVDLNSDEDDIYRYNSLLAETEIFYYAEDYPAALVNVDEVLSSRNKFLLGTTPYTGNQILERAYWDKFEILNKTGNQSSYLFKDSGMTLEFNDAGYYTEVISAELSALNSWLASSKNKEIINEKHLRIQKEISQRITEESLRKSDSLKGSYFLLSNLREDAYQKEKIQKIQNSIAYNKSLDQLNRIRELEARQHEQQISRRNYILLGLTAFLLMIFYIILQRINRQKMERENEVERLNLLSQNNLHNLGNDYATFSNLIDEGDADKISDYNEYYGDYLNRAYDNWKKNKVFLSDELETGTFYFLAKQVRNPYLKFDPQFNLSADQTKKTLFLQSVFDTIIHNSILHGFLNKHDECVIVAKIYLEGEHLICLISDNGIPPESDQAYLTRKDSGLNILKRRVENHYKKYKKKIFNSGLLVYSLPGKTGTAVKITLPYLEYESV